MNTTTKLAPLPSMYQFLNVENAMQRERIARLVDTRLTEAGVDLKKLVLEMEAETPVNQPFLHEFITALIYETNRSSYLVKILDRHAGQYLLACRGRLVEIITTASDKLAIKYSNEPNSEIPANPNTPDPEETTFSGGVNPPGQQPNLDKLFSHAATWLLDGTDMRKFNA